MKLMKFIYYLLHWTWALPMNIVGGIMCLIALCCKCPVQKYRNAIEILVPWNFGGLEMGMFFIRGKDCPSVILPMNTDIRYKCYGGVHYSRLW